MRADRSNHMPWDEGAIHDAVVDVLGLPPVNQTTKTMCGKRVSVSRANHAAPISCDECRAALDHKMEFKLRVMEFLNQWA